MSTRNAMGLLFFFADMVAMEAFNFGDFRGCKVEFLVTYQCCIRERVWTGKFHSLLSAVGYESPLGKSLTSLSLYFLICRMNIIALTSQDGCEIK